MGAKGLYKLRGSRWFFPAPLETSIDAPWLANNAVIASDINGDNESVTNESTVDDQESILKP